MLTSAPVVKVERRRDGVSVFSPALEGGVEEFDDVVFACGAEQTLKILGDDASWRERTFLPNVKYYNDLIVTHEDTSYMDEHYQFDRRDDGDMYMIRVDPNNPKLIEMSFNLTMYQPHLRDGGKAKRDIYQSIFLDDSDTSGWTNGRIRGEKILYKRMTRQFAPPLAAFRVLGAVRSLPPRASTHLACWLAVPGQHPRDCRHDGAGRR